jgi:hypothetical protein
MPYAIQPPPPKAKEWNHPNLPEPVFRCIITAPSGSGKSVLLANMIASPEFPYREYFGKNIFIFSSTFHLDDPSFSIADNIKKKNVFEGLDVGIVSGILEDQESIIMSFGKDKAPPVLLIFDDVSHQLSHSASQYLRQIFFSGRHRKVSILWLVQAYKSLPRAMRINATECIFMAIGNSGERECIQEEMPIEKKAFLAILDDATREPYSFLVVFNRNPMNKRFQKRFTGEYYSINHNSHSRPRNTNGETILEPSDGITPNARNSSDH